MTRPVCPGQWPSRPLRERAVARATVACAAQAHSRPRPRPRPLCGPRLAAWPLPPTTSVSVCPRRPAFVSQLGFLVGVLNVQWVPRASAGGREWGWGGLPCPPPGAPTSSARAPSPIGALWSRAGGRHLEGSGLGRGGQSLRPVSAQPEVLPTLGQGPTCTSCPLPCPCNGNRVPLEGVWGRS